MLLLGIVLGAAGVIALAQFVPAFAALITKKWFK
jgi:hypothetical protein